MRTKNYLLISLFMLIVLSCFFSCARAAKTLAPIEKQIISEIPAADHVQSLIITYQKGFAPVWETEICFPMSICLNSRGGSLAESLVNLNLEFEGTSGK